MQSGGNPAATAHRPRRLAVALCAGIAAGWLGLLPARAQAPAAGPAAGPAAAAAAAPATAPAAASAPGKWQWKLATGYPAEFFHTRNIVEFASALEKASAGQLSVEVIPNGKLFKLADVLPAVQKGDAQAGETIMSSLVKDMPIAGADTVPFVVGSYAEAQRMWEYQRPAIERQFEKRGLKVLFAVAWPPQGLHSKKPITTPADFKNTKMRSYNPATARIAELLGAQPVAVAAADLGKALAEGRVDNMFTSAVTGADNKAWSDIRYYYEMKTWIPKNIVFVNKKAFDSLPAALQKTVMELSAQAQTRGWQMSREEDARGMAEYKAHGVKIDRVSSEIDSIIKRMGEKFSLEWIRTVGNEANEIFVPLMLQGGGAGAPSKP